MGNAFLFQKSGTLRKHREARKKQLAEHLLPSVEVNSVVSAKTLGHIAIEEGETLEICVDANDSMAVFSNRHKIAFIPKMNQGLKERIQAQGGRITARLNRKLPHSELLEISVVERLRGGLDEKSRAATTTAK